MPTERLLIVDDDPVFLRSLQRAMERRQFIVRPCPTYDEALAALENETFTHAIFDLRLERGSGLDLLERANSAHPDMRCVMLTGYGNVPTAVTATKLGAADYLAKPIDADIIDNVLRGSLRPLKKGQTFPRPEVQEFRYLLALYEQHGRNMSETARAAGMHRRTLQRILRRHGVGPSEQIPPPERASPPHLRRLLKLWSQILEAGRA
ncbi:MAG: response regulator [Pseudomonadota bacterium]